MKQFWALPTILSLLSCLTSSQARLTETRRETRELQKALNHKSLVVVIDGVLERIIGDPSPDPLLLINFPDINSQFKVHVLEDSRKISSLWHERMMFGVKTSSWAQRFSCWPRAEPM